jgi:hypothetical protein
MGVSDRQFGTMAKRMRTKGGFTFSPHTKKFVSEGYSVAAYPEAELTMSPRKTSGPAIKSYATGAAPTFARDSEAHIGGWAPGGQKRDVYDIPRVYPKTQEGHAASRQAMLDTNQEASFHLHSFHTEHNPYHLKNQGDVSPQESDKQTWADMPKHSTPTTGGRKIKLRGEGQSFT